MLYLLTGTQMQPQRNTYKPLAEIKQDIIDMFRQLEDAELFSHNLQSEWLEIDFSYWGERNDITSLERAITNQTVEPLRLVFKSHAWYLVAYSQHKIVFVLTSCLA